MNAKILIVEDNKMNRDLVKDLLETKGHNIITAMEAQEALNKIDKSHPDLVLMDVNLPGKNGIQLSKEIKNRELLKNIPIIALTAHATKEETDQISTTGLFKDIITKPIDTRKFPVRIDNILKGDNNG